MRFIQHNLLSGLIAVIVWQLVKQAYLLEQQRLADVDVTLDADVIQDVHLLYREAIVDVIQHHADVQIMVFL